MSLAIEAKEVSKKFRVLHEKQSIIRGVIPNLFRLKEYEEFWALNAISFVLEEGETLGIIGRNGSGKSTLLRILARITPPTEGTVKTNGRISTLLELGAGFQQELTGMENIFLNGTILGLSRREIQDKMDKIIDFAELGSFINSQVKIYSSGMYLRLGFAIAVHIDFDILLIDEILAVGDISFQKKCMERIESFKTEGKTMVMVSQDMRTIDKYCDRVLWLENGRTMILDRAPLAIRGYEGFSSKETPDLHPAKVPSLSPSKKRVLKALKREVPDRVPLEIWLFDQGLEQEIKSKYGSKEKFYEKLRIDLETVIIPPPFPLECVSSKPHLKSIPWEMVLDYSFPDPGNAALYEKLVTTIENTGSERPVSGHIWGVFEAAAYMVGFKTLLLQMTLDEDTVLQLFRKIAVWSQEVARHVIDCGADVLSLSDDCAGHQQLLMHPKTWQRLVFPYDREIFDAAHRRDLPVSFHSHGYIEDILDDIVRLGACALHPIGSYAGMDGQAMKHRYGSRLCLRGGLDMGFSLEDEKDEAVIYKEVREIISTMKPGGGFIFGTNFAIEKGISLEKLEYAYNVAWENGEYHGR